ncbi:hypothetical protein AB0J71_48490 [Nonomuraea sp. NPDC049637]|uniref:hypothetical protein n=1 Tax=Nonomuraea sp. NPDC049637 TaxID=3154356 RepID=UPI00344966D0
MRLQSRAEEELRQAGTERDLQRERAVAAEQQDRVAQAERERDAEQVRELRDRLAAAQASAELVLPAPADLSGDLGEGIREVTLPEVGIAVARQPDGTVVPHHQGRQTRLSDGQHAAAHGRALAAALLALASPRP